MKPTDPIASLPPSKDQVEKAQLALDLSSAALKGEAETIEQLLPKVSATDRVDAAMMACECLHGVIVSRLLDVILDDVPLRSMNSTFTMAARTGMIEAVRGMLQKRPDVNKEEALISALLTRQRDMIVLLAPQTNLGAVVEDIQENYDDAYRLTYDQMAEALDQLAAFTTPRLRQELYNSPGKNLLPLTEAFEKSLHRKNKAGVLPNPVTVRARPRH